MAAALETLNVSLGGERNAEFYFERETRKFGVTGGESFVLPEKGKIDVFVNVCRTPGEPSRLTAEPYNLGGSCRIPAITCWISGDDTDTVYETRDKLRAWLKTLELD